MIDKTRIETLASEIYSKHCKRGVPAKMLPKIVKAENIKFREMITKWANSMRKGRQ